MLLGGKHKDLVSRFEFKEKKIKAKKDNHYRQTRIEAFYFSKNKGNEEYETETGENDKTKCN